MSAAAQIWVELSARDAGFEAFLARMDKKLSTVGGNAEQVWINSRTAAEKYLATLREIERLNTTVDIKSQKTFISDDTAERARIEARRNAASAVGVDESSWERYQRQLQELADAHQQVGFSVEELRRAQTRFREEYQNANPIFAQAERLMRSNATAAENYARQLAEISRLETTRNPLTGQNFIDGDTATRAHQSALRSLIEGMGGEYETAIQRFNRRQQEAAEAMQTSGMTARQYRSILRDIVEEYNRTSPVAQQRNQELAEERALIASMQSPLQRYNQNVNVLARALRAGTIEQSDFNEMQILMFRNMTINQRQFESGKRGLGIYQNAIFQASYGIQDFVQVMDQGLGASLRASANNISQVAMSFGGIKGALAGAALTISGIWLASWLDSEKAIEKNITAVNKLRDRVREMIDLQSRIRANAEDEQRGEKMARKGDAAGLAGRFEELTNQIKNAQGELDALIGKRDFFRKGELAQSFTKDEARQVGQGLIREQRMAGNVDTPTTAALPGSFKKPGAVDRFVYKGREYSKEDFEELIGREALRAGRVDVRNDLVERFGFKKERADDLAGLIKDFDAEINKLSKEIEDANVRLGNAAKQMKKVAEEKNDLPGVAGDMPNLFFRELPKEDFADIRAGQFQRARDARIKADAELADAAREKMFAGRPGGDKMAKILEDLDKGQKNVVAGMQGQDRVNGLQAVQDAANAQLDALQRQLQSGLDSRDARSQKAAFLGAEEFSKQIQTGAIETKAEKAQRETANNTKKMIEEIVKTRESIEKSKGAVFGGK